MDIMVKAGKLVYKGESFSGIYGWYNTVTDKWYVGESKNVLNRIKYYIKSYCKGQRRIYHSIQKHGIESFDCYKLEECDFEFLHERELHWGSVLNSMVPTGYNCKLGGGGKGVTSKETKRKMSLARMGTKPTEETKRKMSLAQKGMPKKSTHFSAECLKRKSISRKAYNKTTKGKANMIKLMTAAHSPEARAKAANTRRVTNLIKWLEAEAPWFCP